MQELLNHRRSLEEIKRRLQNIIELEIEPRLWKIDEAIDNEQGQKNDKSLDKLAYDAGLAITGDPKSPYLGDDYAWKRFEDLKKANKLN
jgi:hypothetical protein